MVHMDFEWEGVEHVQELSSEDIERAGVAAVWRQGFAEANRCANGNGLVADRAASIEKHRFGALCELAAFKWCHLWEPEWVATYDRRGEPDLRFPALGIEVDVKGVPEDRLSLIVKPKELKPDRIYLLVSAEAHPRYRMCGWRMGQEIGPDSYGDWREERKGGGAWYVRDLRPMREFTLRIQRRIERATKERAATARDAVTAAVIASVV